MKHKIAHWYLIISTILVCMMSAILIYWSFFDGVLVHKVLNKDRIVYQTDKEVYYPGDPVFVAVKGLCKYRDMSAQTYMSLIDGISIPYAVKNRSIHKGCIDENKYYLFDYIPNIRLPDGEYYFSGYHRYNINPIRRDDEGIQIYFETNKFRIESYKVP